eukprot:m.9354 g.9354  ORF g.9354 m.9354 type:complete len:53 (+) comp7179_c0_seq1:78-236(+)
MSPTSILCVFSQRDAPKFIDVCVKLILTTTTGTPPTTQTNHQSSILCVCFSA